VSDDRAYALAALGWLVTTGLVLALVERHFGETAADLAAWLPFAMCLRSAWKWRQAKRR
jgi:hypothetical protein